jgi:gamma-glutamyltranspeptidase/glutathione hydrolase
MQPDSFFENGAALDMNSARYSGLSVGVPGTVRGWSLALRRYGSRPLAQLLRPAIAVARRGFVVDQTFANQTTPNIPWFDDLPATAALYVDPDDTPREIGTTLNNPDLAKTLRRIAKLGPAGFYRGPVAQAIAQAVHAPPTGPGADQTWRPGLLTAADLGAYRAIERRPTRIAYRGYDVFSMGPPSSGGTTVGEALNILEQIPGYDAAPEPDKLYAYLEASRLASPTAARTSATRPSRRSPSPPCFPTPSQPRAARPSSCRRRTRRCRRRPSARRPAPSPPPSAGRTSRPPISPWPTRTA